MKTAWFGSKRIAWLWLAAGLLCRACSAEGVGTGETATRPPSYTLTVGLAGTGSGAVSASPKAAAYASGTVVTLTAVPAKGSTFAGWSGGASGAASSVKVTITGNTSVTATFNAIRTYTLTVGMAGMGSGSVSVSPKAAAYASGTVVTLTAMPVAGSSFGGWSGDASGSAKSVKVTITRNTSVTATFNLTTVTGSDYAGTWIGQFNVQYQYGYLDPSTGNTLQGSGSRGFSITITLKSLATADGVSTLTITKVSSDEAMFGTGPGGAAPDFGSSALLPSPPENASTLAGEGIAILFANNAMLATANAVGELHMSSDGSLIGNSVGVTDSWDALSSDGLGYLDFYGLPPNDGWITQSTYTWALTHSTE